MKEPPGSLKLYTSLPSMGMWYGKRDVACINTYITVIQDDTELVTNTSLK